MPIIIGQYQSNTEIHKTQAPLLHQLLSSFNIPFTEGTRTGEDSKDIIIFWMFTTNEHENIRAQGIADGIVATLNHLKKRSKV